MRARSSSTRPRASRPFRASAENTVYITSAPSRSSSIASPTPGYCTLTATSRRSLVSARWTWPMLAAATGRSSQRRNTCSGASPSSASTTDAARRRGHRRGVGLQHGERPLRLVGQSLGDEADELADLHQHALHLAELLGDVLGGADGELGVERGPALGRRDRRGGPDWRRSGCRCGRSSTTSAASATSSPSTSCARPSRRSAPTPMPPAATAAARPRFTPDRAPAGSSPSPRPSPSLPASPSSPASPGRAPSSSSASAASTPARSAAMASRSGSTTAEATAQVIRVLKRHPSVEGPVPRPSTLRWTFNTRMGRCVLSRTWPDARTGGATCRSGC